MPLTVTPGDQHIRCAMLSSKLAARCVALDSITPGTVGPTSNAHGLAESAVPVSW